MIAVQNTFSETTHARAVENFLLPSFYLFSETHLHGKVKTKKQGYMLFYK